MNRIATQPGIFAPSFRATTLGVLTAIVACAFDQTAVTAVMPHIAAALGDSDAYSLTFVATLSASIIGMVGSGLATDRFGARISFLVSSAALAMGLILSIFSPTMAVFLCSRALQGLGTGGLIVAVYAIIAVVYPTRLRQAVFAAFAGAWVVPSLVGPGLAGLLTVTFSWHAVFVFALTAIVVAGILLSRALVCLVEAAPTTTHSQPKMLLGSAVVLAAAVSVMNLASQGERFWAPILLVAAVAVALVALQMLTPRGTLRLARGVPRFIATRGFVDMFFAAEVYLPLMLAQQYGLGPSLTGVAMTITGIFWFLGSQYQARHEQRFSSPMVFRLGVSSMALGTLWVAGFSALHAPWLVVIFGWAFTAVGMGFLYPRMSSKPLELCAPEDTGFTGSALQVMGTTGTTFMLSLSSLVQVFGGVEFLPMIFVLVSVIAVPLLVMWRPAVPEP